MTPTKTRQLWRCPKCEYMYASPVVVERAYCPRHRNGAPAMKLEEGERSFVAPGRLLETSGPSGASTPPARGPAPTAEEPNMMHGTRSATKRKGRAA